MWGSLRLAPTIPRLSLGSKFDWSGGFGSNSVDMGMIHTTYWYATYHLFLGNKMNDLSVSLAELSIIHDPLQMSNMIG